MQDSDLMLVQTLESFPFSQGNEIGIKLISIRWMIRRAFIIICAVYLLSGNRTSGSWLDLCIL